MEDWKIFNLISKSLFKSDLFSDFLSIRKIALNEIANFSQIDLLPLKKEIINHSGPFTISDEKIEIRPIDYYYSNAISRASKTMSDCRNININNKKNGTTN